MDYFPKSFLQILDKMLSSGVRPGMSIEEESAINKANLLCLLACILALIMLLESLRLPGYFFFGVVATTLAGAALCSAAIARTGRPFLPALLLIAGISVFFLSRLSTGGVFGTAFIFIFILPLLYFFTFSLKTALLLFFAVLAGLVALLFLPGDPFLFTEYSMATRRRIFLMYVFFGCGGLLGEYIHWRARQKIARLVGELMAASRTDQLTGLYNRRAFLERFQYEITRSQREKLPLSVVLFDIDHFKSINDQYGHNCGDEALRHLAALLNASIRRQDTAARWGGEEFIVLLPGTAQEGALVLAEKLRAEVEDSFYDCGKSTLRLTVSLGVHHCDLEESVDASIGQVDARLYHAKHLGRNQVCCVLPQSVPFEAEPK